MRVNEDAARVRVVHMRHPLPLGRQGKYYMSSLHPHGKKGDVEY